MSLTELQMGAAIAGCGIGVALGLHLGLRLIPSLCAAVIGSAIGHGIYWVFQSASGVIQ